MGKGDTNRMRVMNSRVVMSWWRKYADGEMEMIDSFLMICLHNRIFCLEQREQKLDQFSTENSMVGESDQCFVLDGL